ncbi:MAG: hypothetical protein P4L67_05555 [Candidatus Pacebacteria bacterium]|nr:hypothetical protein [Candidatus Paceibacterota bacterium]
MAQNFSEQPKKVVESEERREWLSRKIIDLEPIEVDRYQNIGTKEDLESVVEEPLLSACQELWDKNILTEGAGANRKHFSGEYGIAPAYIEIDYDRLSEENKEIAKSMGIVSYSDNHNHVLIEMPMDQSSTGAEVQERAEIIAHRFVKQRFRPETETLDEIKRANRFDPSMTMEEIREELGVDPHDGSFGPQSFYGGYWSPETQLLYKNEGQYKKSLEEVDEKK